METFETKIKILKILIKTHRRDPEKRIQMFNWNYILESLNYDIDSQEDKFDILKFLIKKNYSNPEYKYEFANWTDILEDLVKVVE